VPAKTVQHLDRFAQRRQSRLVDRARTFVEQHPLRVGVDQERGPSVPAFSTRYALFRVAPFSTTT